MPAGGEDDFVTLRTHGEIPAFDFEPRDHLELGELLDAIDMERGTKVSGSRFYFLKGIGARLEFAIMTLALDRALQAGFTPLIPPTLVRPEVMRGTGFLGQHADEVYHLADDDLYLVGTSEVALAGYHMDEILDLSKGAKRYAGWSTCYRREAGSYGKDTRGIIRVHQFNKLEMFVYTTPEDAEAEHLRLVAMQEEMLQSLGLSYRVIDVAAGDLGSSAARKYDVEAWVPTQGAYRELTSTSNCTTYQARRLDIRHRPPARAGGEDAARRDAQRHARDDALDRRDARDAPARRRLGRRSRGAAPVPRRPRGHGAGRVTEAHLPPTGSIKVVKQKKAAKIVERVARDTEDPTVPTERLLIVLDIDGTILLEDETLSPGVVDAVEHAHRAGHEVMLATGRSWEGTEEILRTLKIAPEYVVCSNGAVILRKRDGDDLEYERFHIETFDPTEVLDAAARAPARREVHGRAARRPPPLHRASRRLEPRERRAGAVRGAAAQCRCAASSSSRPATPSRTSSSSSSASA